MPRRFIIGWALCLAWLAACRPPASLPPARPPVSSAALPTPSPATAGKQTLTVFAAASLAEAFTQAAGQFEAANPGVTLSLNFAGSNQLAQQLAHGAPAGVFASAHQKQIAAAVAAGRVDPQQVEALASNSLIVIVPRHNPGGVLALQDLSKAGLKLILAAPEVPAGQYTLEFLARASQDPTAGPGFQDQVLQNVVSYEENVRAVLSKVVLGEADAGIVYTTDIGKADAGKLAALQISDELNVFTSYYVAPVRDGERPELAAAFIDFLLSSAGQDILVEHGFLAVR